MKTFPDTPCQKKENVIIRRHGDDRPLQLSQFVFSNHEERILQGTVSLKFQRVRAHYEETRGIFICEYLILAYIVN